MHLLAVHKNKIRELPWLPSSLFKAFETAKNMAIERLLEENEPMVTYPWIDGVVQEAQRFMGKDFWPYGVEENRKTLEAFLPITLIKVLPNGASQSMRFSFLPPS